MIKKNEDILSFYPIYIYAFKLPFAFSENYIIFTYVYTRPKILEQIARTAWQSNSTTFPQKPFVRMIFMQRRGNGSKKRTKTRLSLQSRTSSICLDEKPSASLNRVGRLDLSERERRRRGRGRSIAYDDARSVQLESRVLAIARRRWTGFERTKISHVLLATPSRRSVTRAFGEHV